MKQAIVFRSDLKIGKGKLAAHAGHAAIAGYVEVSKNYPELAERWVSEGQKKIALKVGSESELMSLFQKAKRKIPAQVIRDAGLTQVEPGTVICIVIGPWHEDDIDRFTKDLKLL
jgi:PTH2 family peptidyl-tRNA hydrolase